jgi:hypothetical protein
MAQKTTTPEPKASRTWEHLEDFVREHVQQFIQVMKTPCRVDRDPPYS